MPDLAEPFETWLLHRVAQAVEAREVSADLLTELQAEMERVRDLPQEEGQALAVQEIAERWGVPVKRFEHLLAAFEAQPTVARHLLLRRLATPGLAGQREGRPHA